MCLFFPFLISVLFLFLYLFTFSFSLDFYIIWYYIWFGLFFFSIEWKQIVMDYRKWKQNSKMKWNFFLVCVCIHTKSTQCSACDCMKESPLVIGIVRGRWEYSHVIAKGKFPFEKQKKSAMASKLDVHFGRIFVRLSNMYYEVWTSSCTLSDSYLLLFLLLFVFIYIFFISFWFRSRRVVVLLFLFRFTESHSYKSVKQRVKVQKKMKSFTLLVVL